MRTLQLARVSRRADARLHYPEATHCRYARGNGFIEATTQTATVDNAALVCQFCRTELHDAAEATAHVEEARSHGYSERRVAAAVALAEATLSAAQLAQRQRDRDEFDKISEALGWAAGVSR
jgi:hypothetical protein